MPVIDHKMIVGWNRFKRGAYLEHYYDQTGDYRTKAVDFTENGWCHAMAVEWLANKAAKGGDNMSFWNWFDSPNAASRLRFLMIEQLIRAKVIKQIAKNILKANLSDRYSMYDVVKHDYDTKVSSHLAKVGLSPKIIVRSSTALDTCSLANDLTSSTGTYAHIAVQFQSLGWHALAAFISVGQCFFMDPNAGEFRFNGLNRFVSWLPSYIGFRYFNIPILQYVITKY